MYRLSIFRSAPPLRLSKNFQLSIVLLALLSVQRLAAQESNTFEMRYFTRDERANGLTDFHGETEWMDLEGRIDMLNQYADYASRYWGNPHLDTPLFSDADVERQLSLIKPQPTTSVRRTIHLDEWRACGYKPGKETEQASRWKLWTAQGGRIEVGMLVLDRVKASAPIPPLGWRFRMRATLAEGSGPLWVDFRGQGGGVLSVPVAKVQDMEIYGDLASRRVFLSSQGRTIGEYDLPGDFGDSIVAFALDARNGHTAISHFALYNFVPQPEVKSTPLRMEMIYDEDFRVVPQMEGWQKAGYDDSAWDAVILPSPHGGEKEAGESYYLRRKVRVGKFDAAYLEMETLDPAGEVWVNGQPAAVLRGREPRRIDIGEYLKPEAENIIAVRVKPYLALHPMLHAPTDHNFGWFLGRTSLLLTDGQDCIAEGLVHTASLAGDSAVQHHRFTIHNASIHSRKASIRINYYPWFPEEGGCVASATRQLELRPRDNVVELDFGIPQPALWAPGHPRLYRVEAVLCDAEGKAVDDWVTTTGIRLIEQRQGVLYVNNRPEMLNGGQNMGFRPPIEYVSRTVRCATNEQIMREMMMVKAMNGNFFRIHVHAEAGVAEGLNDVRFAEFADQMGLYLSWQTAGWIREGEAWNVDIAGYPAYIRSVYNHPSIALWEASNHPNKFKEHSAADTQDYFAQIIQSILTADSTRLISPTSFWQHSHYANYDGTLDYKGNALAPNPWIMHRMVTRGSQDAYSGYTSTWTNIRKIPSDWARQCLEARDLCYFNFEHEESIGQPNWSLARKEPWFEVQSYEWSYNEGNIGRLLQTGEWRASQAYQSFSAWESMKMQTLAGVCGYSWCTMESGANMFTYQKPLIDPFCVPKLAFYANRMAFQRIWAGSDNVDVVYGPGDTIRPVIFNLDEACTVNLVVELQNAKGRTLEKKQFRNIHVPAGRSVTRLDAFRFRKSSEGCCFVVYNIYKQKINNNE